MAPGMKIDGPRIGANPYRDTRSDVLAPRAKSSVATFFLALVFLLPLAAVAQITEPLPLLPSPAPPSAPSAPVSQAPTLSAGQTVINRARPEFDPLGFRFGDYYFFPRAELDESYNSNIFATTTGATYDLLTALSPSFDLVSISPRGSLNLHGGSVLQIYADHPGQNTQDGTVNVDGRLDVTGRSSLYGNAQVTHQHISYGSPNSPTNVAQSSTSPTNLVQTLSSPRGIAQPVTFWDYIARAGYMQGGRRFSYQVEAGVSAAQYNAAPLVGGGVLPQAGSDASISDVAFTGNYEIIPDYLGYVRVGGSLFNYWHATANNSTIYRVDTGLQIAPRHLVSGRVYIGYLVQNYAQSSLGSTSAPDYGGELVWNVTPLTTLTFDGLRTFYTGTPASTTTQVAGPAGSGYLTSTVAVNADHELLRNLLLNINASYENDNFQGIVRTDNVFTGGGGLRYLVNRNLFFGGSFSYQRRASTASGASCSQSILLVKLGTQF
jgi:hypothetical protein